MTIDMSKAKAKAATIKVVLQADSGYTATEEHRISPNQWGDIVGIMNGTRTASIPQIAADQRVVSVAQLERLLNTLLELDGYTKLDDEIRDCLVKEIRGIIGENGNE